MPFGIQPIHILFIILIAFLLFGANKLPEMGRSVGKAITEFRKGAKDMTDGFREEINQAGSTQTASPMIQSTMISSLGASDSARISLAALAGAFCIHCGASNLPEACFCSSCGTKLPEKVS